MGFNGELIWMIISFVLTLLVFSYIFGDNTLFRFVSALFVGITVGYFFVIIVYQVILTRLVAPFYEGSIFAVIPALLSGMLLMKLSPRLSKIGNIPMALLVGVGAAVAVGGAVLGTLFGQIKGAVSFFGPEMNMPESPVLLIAEGVLFLIGTLATLAYFNFGAKDKMKLGPRRSILVAIFAWIGKVFIAITLGAVFAGVLTAAITALVERSDFIFQTITGFIK